jgi:phosphoglycolate phosphatase-like HAD superfamily hydrolase
MAKKYFVFDLDGTLINTAAKRPYMTSNEGKRYLAANPGCIKTQLYDELLLKIVSFLNKTGQAIIATDSPDDYARAMLAKHDFPSDLPLFAAMGKPFPDKFAESMGANEIAPRDLLVIGDSPKDILFAHAIESPSVGVSWGDYDDENIARANPNSVIDHADELEDIIRNFTADKIVHKPRTDPDCYKFFDYKLTDHQMTNHALQDYVPYSRDKKAFYNSGSDKILLFKKAKDYTLKEINTGVSDSYFNKGHVQNGDNIANAVIHFKEKVARAILGLNLPGKTTVVAAPNSLPEYCYQTDINHVAASMVNREYFGGEKCQRLFYRVYPKDEAHQGGSRNDKIHFETIGVKSELQKTDNLIIFDDIYTSGSQIDSIGIMARQLGFVGNLHAFLLGKTIG